MTEEVTRSSAADALMAAEEGQPRDEAGKYASVEEAERVEREGIPDQIEDDLEEGELEEEIEEGDEEEVDDENLVNLEEEDWEKLKVKVKIDGEEQELTLKEVRDGYQRQADYTRKTQELAKQRQAVDETTIRLAQAGQAYTQAYVAMAGEVMNLAPTQEQIDDQWSRDPRQAANMREQRERFAQMSEQFKQYAIAIHRDHQDQVRQKVGEMLHKLPDVIPEWKDEAVRKNELKSVAQYMTERGVSQTELATITNPLAWDLARKAMLYDNLQESAAGKRRKAKATAVRKPTSNVPAKGRRRVVAEAERNFHERGGKRQDAIDLLAALEKG